MIVVLGGSGYVGSEFVRHLKLHGLPHQCLGRADIDLYNPTALSVRLRELKATFLINVAGYTGKPNVDACEMQKADCLMGNAIFPDRIRKACEIAGMPWGHVSSGCIFTGCRPDGEGFRETDVPNFSFRTNNCSFYSGTKALGEELLADCGECYIWRLRIPFNELNSPRNYLSKLMTYRRLLQATNSLSHLSDFVEACLDSWLQKVPFGIYNVTNTGWVTTKEVTELIRKHVAPEQAFDFFESEEEFMAIAAKTPRSNCTMDNSKLRNAGVKMPSVHDALERALTHWRP